ncbi:type II toxin-antitoxin system VapC family toxin [Duganella callida]|uniref:Type II toxin-antitoxin system VapC family toxin n=1 Tax=Duganella callida TaxID=2561932 RepID=A0A4Y9S6J6_9BURK|nr:type II toxin-antitoxin system VapC family toxin [Duganella callida]TFW16138.1 type II toxin-antitoxin system VapC family toxin [Duganella callida]
MRLLLDTHVLLWSLQDDLKLSALAREKILAARPTYVSSASIWEIAIKVSVGKLDVDLDDLLGQIAQIGLRELRVSHKHAAKVKELPLIHRDPFDRLLIGQAVSESLTLLTTDRVLANYSTLVELI